MKKYVMLMILFGSGAEVFAWGFYAHRLINYYAVFSLPPEMLIFYKKHIAYISEHAVDPDKRRYAVAEEGPRHYIDLDRYGAYPYPDLPRKWKEAEIKYGRDSLMSHGIVPWWIQVMIGRLTDAFRDRDPGKILKISAELGHYIGDSHVPLHASSNHNGQLTGQHGIHGFWESRIPELLAETEWEFFTAPAAYLANPLDHTWKIVLQSGRAADSVLALEKVLDRRFPGNAKYAFENRNGVITRQYSAAYTRQYDRMLAGMVERRLTGSIRSVASAWYTAWVNAGQPDLAELLANEPSADPVEMEQLNRSWREGAVKGKSCE